ncbi:MAG: 4Fe-4S dicluster domain-containing protein [Desulfobacteraceae bacterium]|nr:MAG: 4Fe-4S dicluster domain-containing protein [Desulfobacteraceae bacterium]
MENSPKQINLTIDGLQLSVPEGMTILEAARQNGIRIPTLCHHPALSAWGGCRLCVVEVDGSPKLVASCVMPVRDGMKVVTSNSNIITARRTILEFLFAERNHYCMFCSQSGDCELQALAYELQMDHLTVPQSYEQYPVDITSEYMAIDHNRCVLCGRCVRACHEIAGAYVLNYQGRGIKNQIAFDLNMSRGESSCLGCGACLQVCPTGAIFNRYRAHRSVKGHQKDDRSVIDAFCPHCGLMCETRTIVKDNQLLIIEGHIRPGKTGAERGQLCVKGRFEPLKTPGKRLLNPMIREADGTWKAITWKAAMDLIERSMSRREDGTFGLVSSRCANEQLMIFRDLMLKGWAADYLDTLDGRSLRTIAGALEELGKSFLGLKEASWERIPDADHILVAGAASFETQPMIGAVIRRSVIEKRSNVSVIGTFDPVSPWSADYVQAAEGKEPLVMQAFLSEVLKTHSGQLSPGWEPYLSEMKKVNVQNCLDKAGLDNFARESFMTAVNTFAKSRNPIVIAGKGITDLAESGSLRNLMLLSLVKGILPENAMRLVILKSNGNSSGALKLGISSGTQEGKYRRGLMLLDDENLTGSSLLKRFDGIDFLTVITPYFPEALRDNARILIPRPTCLEEEGTYTSLDGREIRTLHATLRRPKGVSESWQTLLALMQRTEFHPSYARWKDISARVTGEMQSGLYV